MMVIKVLGTGCGRCVKLENNVKEAVKKVGVAADVVKITDIKDIMSYGVLGLPALIINDAVVSYGQCPSIDDIAQLIRDNN
jgi:small redox-active disulfide protein 2